MKSPWSSHDDWTPQRGLTRVTTWLAITSPVCLAFWVGWLVATRQAAAWLAATMMPSVWGMAGLAIAVVAAVAIVAWPCGKILAHRLTDRAGFEGPAVAALGVIAVWAVALGGAAIGAAINGPASWVTTMATVAMGGEASLVVLWQTWLNPD